MEDSTDVTNRAFAGFARIDLTRLTYKRKRLCEDIDRHPPSVRKRVDRLVRVFEHEGCIREEKHAIQVVIVDQDALEGQPLPRTLPLQVDQLPRLQSDAMCIHGVHRALAGCRFLAPNDQWWIARVFTKGLPPRDEDRIMDDYSNEQPRLDGIVFLEILEQRKAIGHESRVKEKVQWARLSESKRKDLRQLLDRTDLFHSKTSYLELFSDLTKWRGLWPPVRLGTLHRLLTVKCDHEIVNYLRHVHSIWNAILAGVDDYSPDAVDEQTVACLETAVPGLSTEDMDTIAGEMKSKRIFQKIESEELREKILQNIQRLPGMIPSLYTFFESLKYIEPCAKIMRTLFPHHQKTSIREAFSRVFNEQSTSVEVEYAENDFRPYSPTFPGAAFEVAYFQLWLFALRNFPRMGSVVTLMDPGHDRPQKQTPNPLLKKAFAELALRLGFATDHIKDLAGVDALSQLATQLATSFGTGTHVDDNFVKEIVAILHRQRTVAGPICEPPFTGIENLDKRFRCGIPFTKDHDADRIHLFLPKIFSYSPDRHHHSNVSTFYCKSQMLVGFMGNNLAEEEFSASAVTSRRPSDFEIPSATSCHDCNCQATLIEELQIKIQDLQDLENSNQEEFELRAHSDRRDVEDALRTELDAGARNLEARTNELAELREQLTKLQQSQHGHHQSDAALNERNQTLSSELEASAAALASLQKSHDAISTGKDQLERRYIQLENDYETLSTSAKEGPAASKDATEHVEKINLPLTRRRNLLLLKMVILNIDNTVYAHIVECAHNDPIAGQIANELCTDKYSSYKLVLESVDGRQQKVPDADLQPRVLLQGWQTRGTLVATFEAYRIEVGINKKRKVPTGLGILEWLAWSREDANILGQTASVEHNFSGTNDAEDSSSRRRKQTKEATIVVSPDSES